MEQLYYSALLLGIALSVGWSVYGFLFQVKGLQKSLEETSKRLTQIENRLAVVNDDHIPRKDFNSLQLTVVAHGEAIKYIKETVKRIDSKLS